MSGNPFQKLAKGQDFRVSALAWNELMDVAQREYGGGNAAKSPGTQVAGDHAICRILNSSGSAVDRFAVLGITGLAITPTENANEFRNTPTLTGGTPTTASHLGKFVITLEPISTGKIGRCLLSGICPVQINMLTAGVLWADVKDSDGTKLQSNPLGSAQILYVESGTGAKWALVRLGVKRAGVVPVLVKQNGGSDGTYDDATNTGTVAAWEYDIYNLDDTGYVTKLNTGGTLQPLRSAARVTIGPVVQADDGSEGLAFFGADGSIHLWDCQETVDTEACE
jgi:hypothetical protein